MDFKRSIFFLCAIIVLLPACNILQDGTSKDLIPLDTSFTLRIGETAELENGFRITFQELADDSRCPTRVLCIWAGEVDASFRVFTGLSNETLRYKGFVGVSGESVQQENLEPYSITLERVDPYPGEDEEAEITATLRVILTPPR